MIRFDMWLARKLLLSRKSVGYISWSGVISIAGVAVGCFALTVSIAVLNGFEEEIQQRVIGFESDLRISGKSFDDEYRSELESILSRTDGIGSVSFYLEKKGIIMSGKERTMVRIKAVEPDRFSEIYAINGGASFFTQEGQPAVQLGRGVADRLGVGEGDSATLVSPLQNQIYLGFPAVARVTVGSVFETKVLNFDQEYCFIPLEIGQGVFGMAGNYHGVDIRLSSTASPDDVKKKVAPLLTEGFEISTWADLHQTLFSAMKMEKLGSIVVLSLIVVVASFNIVSTLIMLVMEKVKEIGILRAMGITRRRIGRIIALQGTFIGVSGLILGLGSGLSFVLVQQKWGLIKLPAAIYFVESLPVQMPPGDVFLVAAVGLLLIGSALFYPARVAGKLLPREAIQFEK